MPENSYIDLTPSFEDVPPETWSGIDVNRAFNSMLERADIDPTSAEAGTIGLRELARRQRIRPLSEESRARLERMSPRILHMLEEAYNKQQWEIENDFR